MKLKNKLKEIRMKEHMLGSKEFAEKLGVPRSTYSQWGRESAFCWQIAVIIIFSLERGVPHIVFSGKRSHCRREKRDNGKWYGKKNKERFRNFLCRNFIGDKIEMI